VLCILFIYNVRCYGLFRSDFKSLINLDMLRLFEDLKNLNLCE